MPEKQKDFNSRPSARGDLCRFSQPTASIYFNSRPSARGDGCCRGRCSARAISIHAPPRGATSVVTPSASANFTFQFTPLREGRRGSVSLIGQPNSFQFTPLREGRPYSTRCTMPVLLISIHAPPRGATPRCADGRVCKKISIHAPPRGATPVLVRVVSAGCISIHAPPRGATT